MTRKERIAWYVVFETIWDKVLIFFSNTVRGPHLCNIEEAIKFRGPSEVHAEFGSSSMLR